MTRKTFFIMVVMLAALISGVYAQARSNGRGGAGGFGQDASFVEGISSVLEALPMEELSPEDIDGLMLMREEEKLARDVYSVLGEEWGIPVFENISRSEETHMEAVGAILDRYGLTDPVVDDTVGVFQSSELAAIYTDLVDAGMESLTDALKVGALVEELDIADLLRLMEDADNEDVLTVYQNLLKGSRNHLRSFDMQITRSGDSYSPQYLSAGEFQRIASSPRESGGVITDTTMVF